MQLLKTMIWTLILLTATLCAPVIEDPYDLIADLNIGDIDGNSGENTLDALYKILDVLVEELKRKEENRALNKFKAQEIDQLLYNLEYYLRNKKGETELDTEYITSENNENGDEIDYDMTNELDIQETDIREYLHSVFEYIDINIADILVELIYEFKKDSMIETSEPARGRLQKAAISPELLKEKLNYMEAIMYDVLAAETDIQESDKMQKRASKDGPKEAPLVDVDLQVGSQTTKGIDDFNMKLMYEKRGATCTLINGYSKTPIYVISTCRLGFVRSRIWELCEHRTPFSARLHQENIIDITKTPVQDSDGLVYGNVYCAQCNDVTVVRAWTTKIDCEHMQPLSLSDGTDQVTLMREFADRTMGCVRMLYPAIPRMIHQCSHIDVINTMRYHVTRVGDGYKKDSSPFPLSFSILMNFGFDGKTHILFSTTSDSQSTSVTCSVNEKYDPQFQKCRPIVCYDGYTLIDGTCVKTASNEINAEPDDLSNLQNVDEPLQIILTIKNVTYGDICMLLLDGIEDLVIYNLATMFNISATRIQNLTIGLVNSTELANRTGDSIEIHRFTTPLPSKLATHIDYSKKIEHSDLSVAPTKPSIDESANVDSRTTKAYKIYENPLSRPENDESSSSDFDSVAIGLHNGTDNSSTDAVKDKNTDLDNPSVETDKYKNETDEKQMIGGETPGDDLDMVQGVSDCFWAKNLGLSVRITFVLKPAHKNRTILEKSVKTVVQTMSDLVNSNAFMLTINGTDFKVQGVQNTPDGSSMDEFCQKGVHPLLDDTEFNIIMVYDNTTKESVTVITVNDDEERYYPGQYDLSVNIDGNVGDLNQTIVSSWVFVCKMPKIADKECGRVALMKGEYQVFENKSIWFVNRTYNMSEYEYVSEKAETVRICTPADWVAIQQIQEEGRWTLACGEDLIKVVIAESYLSFILGVVSLICMLSVLITYGLFDKLRNLPGMNTMNLTFSLFMGELVFIISGWIQPRHAWLCSAVGVLLHYLFLTSFFWMNVMAFDVFRTFGNKCILTRVRNKKKFLPRYLLYAWGCPLLIVTFCCVLDFTDLIKSVDIGYGGASALDSDINYDVANSTDPSGSHVYRIGCWIQSPVASMVAFGGPMILILFGNALMFIRTIICIQASTRDARSSVRRPTLKRMTGKDDVMLYVRISTVMGFTWVFGLASSVISAFAGPTSHTICITLHLLGILFIVFNCSQGIFIFFAFVFNRRILAMYKELSVKIKTGRSRQISTSSSRGTLTTNVSATSLSHIT